MKKGSGIRVVVRRMDSGQLPPFPSRDVLVRSRSVPERVSRFPAKALKAAYFPGGDASRSAFACKYAGPCPRLRKLLSPLHGRPFFKVRHIQSFFPLYGNSPLLSNYTPKTGVFALKAVTFDLKVITFDLN